MVQTIRLPKDVEKDFKKIREHYKKFGLSLGHADILRILVETWKKVHRKLD